MGVSGYSIGIFIQRHSGLYMKWVNFITSKLYLNKATKKFKEKQDSVSTVIAATKS